jgi:hypothetical protein
MHTGWGGAIVEVSSRGKNLVNDFDHGREVQLTLWGGEQTYERCEPGESFGWNPDQAGDRYGHDSQVVAESLGMDFVYTKTIPVEWCPDGKGGGAEESVATPVVMEQWVSITPQDWRAISVRYRITYAGSEVHSNAPQELPAVYVNREYHHFIYYAGSKPWRQDSVTDTTLAVPFPPRVVHTAEKWLTLADTTGFGLTVFTPAQHPYGVGLSLPGDQREGNAAVFYRPLITASWFPGMVLEGEYYLIPGHYRDARQIVYELHGRIRSVSKTTPFGFVDTPRKGSTLSGRIAVTGWAIDDDGVARIEVSLDGQLLGPAQLGTLRPDLPNGPFPAVSSRAGYQYWLDTTKFPNGKHTLDVAMIDTRGNRAYYGGIAITIAN